MDSLPGFLQRLWARSLLAALGLRRRDGLTGFSGSARRGVPPPPGMDSDSHGRQGRLELGRRTFVFRSKLRSDQVPPSWIHSGIYAHVQGRNSESGGHTGDAGHRGAQGHRGRGAEGEVWGPGFALCPLPPLLLCTYFRGPCSPSLFFTENRSTSCEAP